MYRAQRYRAQRDIHTATSDDEEVRRRRRRQREQAAACRARIKLRDAVLGKPLPVSQWAAPEKKTASTVPPMARGFAVPLPRTLPSARLLAPQSGAPPLPWLQRLDDGQVASAVGLDTAAVAAARQMVLDQPQQQQRALLPPPPQSTVLPVVVAATATAAVAAGRGVSASSF